MRTAILVFVLSAAALAQPVKKPCTSGVTTNCTPQVDGSGNIAFPGNATIGATLPAGAPTGTAAAGVVYDPTRARNIKAFGAICNGATHPLSTRYGTLAAAQAVYPHATSLSQEIDWAATQAAINALDDGTAIEGTVLIPMIRGGCYSNATVTIGDGSKFLQVSIKGETPFNQAASNPLILSGFTVTADVPAFTVNWPSGRAASFHAENIQIRYSVANSSAAFRNTGYAGGMYERISIDSASKGISLEGGSLSVSIDKTTFFGCAQPLDLTGSNNLLSVANTYFQSGTSAIVVEANGSMTSATLTSVVFEGNSADEITVANGGNISKLNLVGCWWESPLTNHSLFKNSGTGYIVYVTLTGCFLIGGDESAAVNIFTNGASAASSANILGIAFINCTVGKLKGSSTPAGYGYVTYAASDPFAASDPGFEDFTFINTLLTSGNTVGLKGFHTRFTAGNSSINFIGPGADQSGLVITSSAYASTKSEMFQLMGSATIARGSMLGWVPVPATAGASCSPNEWSNDATYLYLCMSWGTWGRVALASW